MMQLKLSNFRCHRNATFEIPTSGLILIKGKKGQGKSTIMQSIYFAFYGKAIRPYCHGTKTCTVQLDDPRTGLSIVRTRTPNRLVVTYKDKKYEDDAAQGVINKIMGLNIEEFRVSSYFIQNKHSSIFSMSPAEQLEFIETIASFNEEYESIKTKTRDHLKALESESTKYKAQLELIQRQIAEHDKTIDQKLNIPENIEENYKQLKIQEEEVNKALISTQSLIKSKRITLDKKLGEETEEKRIETDRIRIETQLKCHQDIRGKLGVVMSEEDIKKMTDDVNILRKTISNIEDLDKANKLEKEYKEQSKQFLDKVQFELSGLKTKIMSKEDIDNAIKTIENYEIMKSKYDEEEREIKRLSDEKTKAITFLANIQKELIGKKKVKSISKYLEAKIPELEKEIQKLLDIFEIAQCEILSCPKCKENLQLRDGSLCDIPKGFDTNISDEQISKIEKEMENKQKEYDSLVEKLKLIKTAELQANIILPKVVNEVKLISLKEFQALTIKISEQKELLLSIQKLESCELPSSILRLQTQFKDLKKGLPKKIDESANLEQLQDKVKLLDKEIDEAWRVRGEHTKLSREIAKYEKSLQAFNKDFLIKSTTGSSIKELKSDIERLSQKEEELSKKFKDTRTELELMKKYEQYIQDKKKIDKLHDMEKELDKNIEDNNKRIQGAEGLKFASKEAEFITLENTIRNINLHTKPFLDQLFDEPIKVELCVKKTTKKGDMASAPSIEVRVEYNGEEYDNIDDLSGGEHQICNICFLLGVNAMLDSHIILFDESLVGLDSQTDMMIVQKIAELCVDKQIIVISHRTIEGLFDHTISL
jgi:DNA repair exonuclease SbcCD ATPase subunit